VFHIHGFLFNHIHFRSGYNAMAFSTEQHHKLLTSSLTHSLVFEFILFNIAFLDNILYLHARVFVLFITGKRLKLTGHEIVDM